MSTPPAVTGPAPDTRPVRVWDLVLSIVLLAVAGVLGVLMFVMSPFLVMASDPCGALECNDTQMTVGFFLALIGPIVVTVAGIVGTIVMLVLRRLAFWVPLATSVLAVGIFVLGAAIVIGGVPGATF